VGQSGQVLRRQGRLTIPKGRLVSELADHPNRLLVTVAPETGATPPVPHSASTETRGVATAGPTYAEVAHEAIFRRWDKLREWIVAEREFLAWRSGLETAWRAWQEAPDGSKRPSAP